MEPKNQLPLSCELLDYVVDHVAVTRVKPTAGQGTLKITPDIGWQKDKRNFTALLVVGYVCKNVQFKCAIQGRFRLAETVEDRHLVNAWVNGETMLYGVVRGLFTPLVAQAIHQTLFLPSVMMQNEVARRIMELREVRQKSLREKASGDKSQDGAEKTK